MTVHQMTEHQMTVHQMTVRQMTVRQMTVDITNLLTNIGTDFNLSIFYALTGFCVETKWSNCNRGGGGEAKRELSLGIAK